eukprot:SAG31_NODE_31464_length_367_cov_53.376866_1_plen_24_part_10
MRHFGRAHLIYDFQCIVFLDEFTC